MTCCKSSYSGNFTYLSKIFPAIAVQTSWMHLCTVDFPTPNRLAIVRYSAEEAIQYTAMATLWSSWSGSRTDLAWSGKLGRKSSHKISKVAFVIRKFSIRLSSLDVPFTMSVHLSHSLFLPNSFLMRQPKGRPSTQITWQLSPLFFN